MQIRSLRASELELAWELDADSFHLAPDRREPWLRSTDPERLLGAFEGERLVGMTAVRPFGQYFGGEVVPMGGLSGVAVVPDWRGRGLAGLLCTAALAAMHERGEAISSLFPGTTSLYRGLGWELAGSVAVRRVPPRALLALPRESGGRVRPMREADDAAVRECYGRLARGVNGCLARPAEWWERRRAGWSERGRFVFESDAGGLEGYLAYRQHDGEYTHLGGDFGIAVDELVATSRDAALALWRLLGSWGSQADHIAFRGPVEDPLLLSLAEQELSTLVDFRWMTRLVDAPAAVAARGFPAGLELEVPLSLRDPLLSHNDGDFVLQVAAGRGELIRCERRAEGARPALAIGAASSLYTGWAGTGALERAGALEGGTPEQRAALDAAFAGPTAWMLDEF